ncbi:MarR family transcriptional regulator [Nocardioides sp. BGMRC 2183]|nr:MarR family transcriptional regulator [Nocardioides sp. BGMRC 2183]
MSNIRRLSVELSAKGKHVTAARSMPSGSPPTDRVVAVTELIARHPDGRTVAQVCSQLELSRATGTAILGSLRSAGWVERRPDRSYVLGPGLVGVAHALERALPTGAATTEVLDDLAARVGCGAALTRVSGDQVTFVAMSRDDHRRAAGVELGSRFPLRAPSSAAVIAYASDPVRRDWLASGAEADRAMLTALLDDIRDTGVAVFAMEEAEQTLLEVLGEMAEVLREHPSRRALRDRVGGLLLEIGGRPYTATELTAELPLSIGHLSAPVPNPRGEVTYQVQIGPMRTAVPPAERADYILELRAAAERLADQGSS